MNAAKPSEFKHTTLKHYPESFVDGKWTPKVVGITLMDESPGFTGIYLRDAEGGLWPARTVNRKDKAHHKRVVDAWLSKPGIHEDRRKKR